MSCKRQASELYFKWVVVKSPSFDIYFSSFNDYLTFFVKVFFIPQTVLAFTDSNFNFRDTSSGEVLNIIAKNLLLLVSLQ